MVTEELQSNGSVILQWIIADESSVEINCFKYA